MLAETVLIRRASGGVHLNLEPFWSWRVWETQKGQIMTNVVMFIPVGILAGWVWKWKGLWAAAGLSLVIEVLQLVTSRGLCETDDVFHNCLGAAIGVGISILMGRLPNKGQKNC